MDEAIIRQLTPTGALRVGINMSNAFLVGGEDENGEPVGVSPDMGREAARRLGVPVRFVKYPTPGAVADAVGEWDIGNIGAEPQRAKFIAFTPAYAEIEATYILPSGSGIQSFEEIDQPGRKIVVKARAAYALWLERNLKHATLTTIDPDTDAFDIFKEGGFDAMAGLKKLLLARAPELAGARVMDGRFMAVQQAIGTPIENSEAANWLTDFVEDAKSSGLVDRLIEKHGAAGLTSAK